MQPFQRDENQHLTETLEIVKRNIEFYTKRVAEVKKENDELNDSITPRDRELNSQMFVQLSISTAILEHVQNSLRKNKAASSTPYFGRIDYEETRSGLQESLYIGKNGVQGPEDSIVVIDWRAPVAKVYYENENGVGSYAVPEGDPMEIDLVLKRTFDIENAHLNGYYDSDIASNDQLLVKYLAKTKTLCSAILSLPFKKSKTVLSATRPIKILLYRALPAAEKPR